MDFSGLIIVALAVLSIGGFLLIITWILTARVERVWLRYLPRAAVIALAFTPTVLPESSLHGSVPVPAVVALATGLFGGPEDTRVCVVYGGVPLLMVFSVVWSLAIFIAYVKKRYPAV